MAHDLLVAPVRTPGACMVRPSGPASTGGPGPGVQEVLPAGWTWDPACGYWACHALGPGGLAATVTPEGNMGTEGPVPPRVLAACWRRAARLHLSVWRTLAARTAEERQAAEEAKAQQRREMIEACRRAAASIPPVPEPREDEPVALPPVDLPEDDRARAFAAWVASGWTDAHEAHVPPEVLADFDDDIGNMEMDLGDGAGLFLVRQPRKLHVNGLGREQEKRRKRWLAEHRVRLAALERMP